MSHRFLFLKRGNLSNRMGHKSPIKSYGLIAYHKAVDGTIRFCIFQRRDTFEYMDFIRGLWNETTVRTLFILMTNEERERIRNYVFQELWDDLWINHSSKIYREGFNRAKRKYEAIKKFIPRFIDGTVSNVVSPPWGFPKGKRNGNKETTITCAIREFEEETRIDKNLIVHIYSDVCFEEVFKGSNRRLYSTNYYLVEVSEPIVPEKYRTPQCIREETLSEEVNQIKWLTVDEAKSFLVTRRLNMLYQALDIIPV